MPLPVFFQNSVRRIMKDGLDFVLARSDGTRNIESLALIDEFPIPGERIRYHFAYEMTDSRRGLTVLGLVLDRPRLLLPTKYTHPKEGGYKPWAQRRNSRRHYFETGQGLGILAHHYTAGPLHDREPLEGQIEDPHRIDDPLDGNKVRTLKADIDALRRAKPVKPLTDLFRLPLDI